MFCTMSVICFWQCSQSGLKYSNTKVLPLGMESVVKMVVLSIMSDLKDGSFSRRSGEYKKYPDVNNTSNSICMEARRVEERFLIFMDIKFQFCFDFSD